MFTGRGKSSGGRKETRGVSSSPWGGEEEREERRAETGESGGVVAATRTRLAEGKEGRKEEKASICSERALAVYKGPPYCGYVLSC